MNTKAFIIFLSLLIVGCDGEKISPEKTNKNTGNMIEFSSLPLIQKTLSEISPTFGGKRNDLIMRHICALSKGIESQDDFDKFFASKGIEPAKLASKDSGFALLAERDINKMHSACVSYMISSLAIPLQKSYYIKKINDKQYEEQKLSLELTNMLRDRMKIAAASAEFLAIISAKLENSTVKSMEDVKKNIFLFVSENARYYYNLVDDEMIKSTSEDYNINTWSDLGISFSSSNGYSYDLKDGVLDLKYLGVDWYGRGKLLGKNYFIKLNVADYISNNNK